MIIHGNMHFETKSEFEEFKRLYPLKYKPCEHWGVMPEFYHHRRDGSDAVFIDEKLSRLSAENRKLVAIDYREVYLRQGRNEANRFLIDQVKQFGISKTEYEKAVREFKMPLKLAARIEELKKMKKRSRSKFSHIFSD